MQIDIFNDILLYVIGGSTFSCRGRRMAAMVPDPAPTSDGDRELFRDIWRIDVKPWAEAEEGGV